MHSRLRVVEEVSGRGLAYMYNDRRRISLCCVDMRESGSGRAIDRKQSVCNYDVQTHAAGMFMSLCIGLHPLVQRAEVGR